MQILENTAKKYLSAISFLGILTFVILNDFNNHSNNDWITILSLTCSILILNYFLIKLPPKGNSLSMDSSVFLACLFLYGLDFTLDVLFVFSVVYLFIKRKIKWWQHLFNFAIYTMMLVSTNYLFTITGGEIGTVEIKQILPYIFSLLIYFATNVLFIGVYFLLEETESVSSVVEGMIKEAVATYFSTILLSLVLAILMKSQDLFGLFLYICISVLLALAFKQHFQLFKEVAEKANKDFLTGLNNHGYFKELFEKEVQLAKETGQPLSVSILDLDDFKKYNDLNGHIQGDHLLKEFGTLLKEQAEAKKYTVARYGGEEFALLMPQTSRHHAFSFLNELRKKTNDTYFKGVDGLAYGCLSFSAGIAEYESGVYNINELLNKADQAMYAAKDQGKNLVRIFNEHSEYDSQKSLAIEKDLEEAEQQLKIFLSKDVYTYRHSKRVYQYAANFSKCIDLTDHERKTLILGALIHDIGKLEIPRDILTKKGKLEPHEWEMMKKHVTWGKEIISTNKKLEDLIPLVELHHERYDGNGYPYGLQGKTIPKLARILCLIDSFDAMTTERPYQKTKTFAEAIVELRACSGKQFDPQFVEPFIEMIKMNDTVELETKVLVTK
ncbi:diguanylate cyclase (GGDEF) domain-containing protein [Bacillus sp. cl95]|nr:diguanylate cyclase (GGDEF) domain-containing protein [Bacillus sp. UNCCL13]SFQ90882.1 diguanylate cyclase (GGDEF) domain-containing protein [Bacillus sp. cl95]